jgi:hypothetical protein
MQRNSSCPRSRIVIPTGAKRSGGTCGFFSGKKPIIVLYKT